MYYALKYIVKGSKPKKGSVFTWYWQYRHPCGFTSPEFEWYISEEGSRQKDKLRGWLHSHRNHLCPCRKKVNLDYKPRKRCRSYRYRNRLWWRLWQREYVKRR